MDISVILSTYNAPGALEFALSGYATQTTRDFELVIADDGSTSETKELLRRVQASSGLRIRHVWQEDDGFRKSRILNRAIEAARGEYLIFSDGDCIPRADFVETHARLARPDRFLSGGRIDLQARVGADLSLEDVAAGVIFRPDWLRAHDALTRTRDLNKLAPTPRAARLRDRWTPTRATWNGHNASGWTRDLVAANGFDERMRYLGQDRELGERLRNAGIRPVQVRHRALVAHIDHARPWVEPERHAFNAQIRRRTRGLPRALWMFEGLVRGLTWTEHGIHKGPRPQ